jgi:putative methyltransferase (TIGR04325 family)
MGLFASFAATALRHLPSSGTLSGYNDPALVDFIFEKTKSIRHFEPWPEMSGITSVLDFGGGCGHHFFRAVRQSPAIRWAVVETPDMVKRASELETDGLRFFSDISSALAWLGAPQVVHCNGALQFTDDPARF